MGCILNSYMFTKEFTTLLPTLRFHPFIMILWRTNAAHLFVELPFGRLPDAVRQRRCRVLVHQTEAVYPSHRARVLDIRTCKATKPTDPAVHGQHDTTEDSMKAMLNDEWGKSKGAENTEEEELNTSAGFLHQDASTSGIKVEKLPSYRNTAPL